MSALPEADTPHTSVDFVATATSVNGEVGEDVESLIDRQDRYRLGCMTTEHIELCPTIFRGDKVVYGRIVEISAGDVVDVILFVDTIPLRV